MATFGQICLWFILSPESSYHGEILQCSPSPSVTTHSWAIALGGDYLMGLALGCPVIALLSEPKLFSPGCRNLTLAISRLREMECHHEMS